MRRDRGLQLIITDVAGTGVLAVCLVAAGWLTFVRSNQTTQEINELRNRVGSDRRELISVRHRAEQATLELTKARTKLDAVGQLPARPPVERYSQTVLDLAARHQLRVIRQNPVASRAYPGLLEERYEYEMRGATRDFVAFFAAIEMTDYWGDISYLKIDSGASSRVGSTANRHASFTVSLFSAPPIEQKKKDGSG